MESSGSRLGIDGKTVVIIMVVATSGSSRLRRRSSTFGWPAWRWVNVSVSSRCIYSA